MNRHATGRTLCAVNSLRAKRAGYNGLVRQPGCLSPKSLQNAWHFAFSSGSWPSNAWLAEASVSEQL
jgi:hypothetical protein